MNEPQPLHNGDPRLGELARELHEVIERRADGQIPYAAVIGILQILIHDLYDELKGRE